MRDKMNAVPRQTQPPQAIAAAVAKKTVKTFEREWVSDSQTDAAPRMKS
jgi:hypothetical protein